MWFLPRLLLLLALLADNSATNKYQCHAWMIHSTTQEHPRYYLYKTTAEAFLSRPAVDKRFGRIMATHVLPGQQGRLLRHPQLSVHMQLSPWELDEFTIMEVASPSVLLVLALVLGIAANGWIQKLLSGDQGLGSFLSDGSGFNKSGFKRVTGTEDERAVKSDPLPWLSLPRLDFVDVAGQDAQDALLKEDYEQEQGRASQKSQHDAVMGKLERLRESMNEALAQGNIDEATARRTELETLMKENNIQYFRD